MSPSSTLILTARLARWIPAVGWLASYRLSWLRVDLAAGVTVAAYLLPAGLGDASLANLPPEAGLYACMFGGLIFWLFCSSRHTTITVTSANSADTTPATRLPESTAPVGQSESKLTLGSWSSDGHQVVRPPPGARLPERGNRGPAGHARRIYALNAQ